MSNFLNWQTDNVPAKRHKRPYRRACNKCNTLQFRPNDEIFLCGFCKNNFYAPHNWGSIKRKLLQSKGNSCEICNRQEHIQIHHKDKDRSNNDEQNLQVLCIHCHQSIHRNWGKKLIDVYVGKFGTRLTWAQATLT